MLEAADGADGADGGVEADWVSESGPAPAAVTVTCTSLLGGTSSCDPERLPVPRELLGPALAWARGAAPFGTGPALAGLDANLDASRFEGSGLGASLLELPASGAEGWGVDGGTTAGPAPEDALACAELEGSASLMAGAAEIGSWAAAGAGLESMLLLLPRSEGRAGSSCTCRL